MRLAVNKTYKMLIGGAFVRSESNRTLVTTVGQSEFNTPRATRKDVRDSVKAARDAFTSWSGRMAYNRGQILYRLAEMLEARTDEFVTVLGTQRGEQDAQAAVDCLLYYAGWTDKFQQLCGSVNPVAMPYFNFSLPEPMGVAGLACAASEHPLLAMVGLLAPCIAGGNTCVLLAPDDAAVAACEFGEVIETSDVPSGVVNILTGSQSETLPHLAKHMDVNVLAVSDEQYESVVDSATENLKRIRISKPNGQGLHRIMDFQETKTVWHPVGV